MKIIIPIIIMILMLGLVQAALIDNDATIWTFDITNTDPNIKVDIQHIGNNTIEMFVRKKTELSAASNFDIVMCDKEGVSDLDFDAGYGLWDAPKEDLTKSGFNVDWCKEQAGQGYHILYNEGLTYMDKSIKLHLPNGAESFKLYIGKGTVEIDANAHSDGLHYSDGDNICQDSKGNYHIAYFGASNHPQYANSTDRNTWSITELSTNLVIDVGIVCLANDSLLIHWEYQDDIDGVYGDIYNGFSSVFTLYDSANAFTYSSCAGDSDSNYHCAIADSSARIFYLNSTDLGNLETVNDNTNDDTDVFELQVYNEYPYIFGGGSDDSDIDVWSTALNGWGDGNRVEIYSGSGISAYTTGYGLSTYIMNDTIYIAFIESLKLEFCRDDMGALGGASCQELDASASRFPVIGVNPNGLVNIFYTATTGAGSLYQANSSDGISFVARQDTGFDGDGISMIKNYTDEINIIYMDVSDLQIDWWDVPFTIEGCTPNIINTSWGTWNNITACQANNDSTLKWQNLTQYDSNNCGGGNTSFYNYSYDHCNYCSYNVVNKSTGWVNITCLETNFMNQSNTTTEYDINYTTCFAITTNTTDLWNGGLNNTYIEYTNTTEVCTFSPPTPRGTRKFVFDGLLFVLNPTGCDEGDVVKWHSTGELYCD